MGLKHATGLILKIPLQRDNSGSHYQILGKLLLLLCKGILEIEAVPVKAKLLLGKIELKLRL